MKTIGILAGMSWESSVTYYQELNTFVRERLGGLHSARCILYSVDFHYVEACMARGDWDGAARIVSAGAVALEKAGADFFLLATNTVHKVAPALQAAVKIPFLHIADATADELTEKGIRTVGLLGTRYTMEEPFYRERLDTRGFEVMVPDADHRARLNAIIFEELCLGVVKPESKAFLLDCIETFRRDGAEAAILGCTELGMLASQKDSELPLFDTTIIHARRAALLALEEN
jgi:aspartate racemase